MTTDDTERISLNQGNNIILTPKKRTLRDTSIEKKANYVFKRKYKRIYKSKSCSDNKNDSDKYKKNKDQSQTYKTQQVNKRSKRLPRIKVIFSTVNWFLPTDIKEANSLHDKITFFIQTILHYIEPQIIILRIMMNTMIGMGDCQRRRLLII